MFRMRGSQIRRIGALPQAQALPHKVRTRPSADFFALGPRLDQDLTAFGCAVCKIPLPPSRLHALLPSKVAK
jgi:hypothetical protein